MRRTYLAGAVILVALLLMVMPASAAVERVTNGNFNNVIPFGWDSDQSGSSSSGGGFVDFDSQTYADFSVETRSETVWSEITQNVNFNQVNDLTFYLDRSGFSPYNWGITFKVYIGSDEVYSASGSDILTGSQTIDASAYTGTQTLKFYCEAYSNGNAVQFGNVHLSAVSALAIVSPPTVSSITSNVSTQNINIPISFNITYSGGDPITTAGQAWLFVGFGDGGYTNVELYMETSPVTVTHTYTTVGDYVASAYCLRHWGTATEAKYANVSIIPAKPAGISISVTPSVAEVGTAITFVASASSGGSVDNWTWNWGDGSINQTYTSSTATHIYSTPGTYSVTATANGPGGSTSYTKTNAVTIGNTYVEMDKTTYYIGEDSQITASYSITSFNIGNSYSLQLWKLDSAYALVSVINSIPITGSGSIVSGTETFSIASITDAGNYGVYLIMNDGYIAYDTAQIRYNGTTLVVNILSGNTVVSAEATVQLQNASGTVDTKTTSTGSVFFAPLINQATYTIVVNATGYSQASKTVTLSGDTTVNIDLGGAVVAGYGAQYEPISCAWIVYSQYGQILSGVQVTCVGVEASAPIAFINQLFNTALGETLITQPQTLTTDSRGQVTFMVLPNVRYKLTFVYNGVSTQQYYNIGPTLSTYTVKITTNAPAVQYNISSSVEAANGIISVKYIDHSQLTSTVNITILDADGAVVNEWSAPTNSANQTFTIQDYYNKDLTVKITASTSIGVWEKSYSVHFSGPRLDLGIPPELLTWIAAFLTFAVGALFTRFTVPIGTVATSFFLWLMYGIGWLWQIEAAIGAPALILTLTMATVMAIMFVMAERH